MKRVKVGDYVKYIGGERTIIERTSAVENKGVVKNVWNSMCLVLFPGVGECVCKTINLIVIGKYMDYDVGDTVLIKSGTFSGKIGIIRYVDLDNSRYAVEIPLMNGAYIKSTCGGTVPSGKGIWYRHHSLKKVNI